jgi:small subunit ribosomal protein S1
MSADRPEDSFAAMFEASSQNQTRARHVHVGETVDAVVIQVGKDAVFVELASHGQGFIESVELIAPDGTLKAAVGDRIRARVVQIDSEGIRLSPTIEAAAAAGASVNIGASDEAAQVKVAVGQVISGTVDRIESYGLFVQVDGTKGRAGRGLLPATELGAPRGTDLRKAFPLGTKLRAKVIEIGEGRMRLSVRALTADEEHAQFEGFRSGDKAEAAAPPTFGTLGDLLSKVRKPT